MIPNHTLGMEGISAAVYSLAALTTAIIYMVIVAQIPTIYDGPIAGNLITALTICFFLGVFMFFAVAHFVPSHATNVLMWCVFMTHVVCLPLALFGAVGAAASVADAKKVLSS